jgi:hypothetical protein
MTQKTFNKGDIVRRTPYVGDGSPDSMNGYWYVNLIVDVNDANETYKCLCLYSTIEEECGDTYVHYHYSDPIRYWIKVA